MKLRNGSGTIVKLELRKLLSRHSRTEFITESLVLTSTRVDGNLFEAIPLKLESPKNEHRPSVSGRRGDFHRTCRTKLIKLPSHLGLCHATS